MVKHYYPSRKIPKVVKVSIFQQVFGHRVLQEWFKKSSLHGVVPVIIGAAATLTGYFDMYVRSVAVMICAGWFRIDVGIWLAQTKSKFKEPIFWLVLWLHLLSGNGHHVLVSYLDTPRATRRRAPKFVCSG